MIDITNAEEILNKDHYGFEKVKERVLEYLAVQKLTNSLKGPILCLSRSSGCWENIVSTFYCNIVKP